MAEYIERDKALNVCEMHYKHCISMQDWRGDTIAWNIGADIKTIPAAEVVEVKHGKWKNNKNDYPECTNCGYMPMYDHSIDDIYYSPYCPNCGVKMDGDSNV